MLWAEALAGAVFWCALAGRGGFMCGLARQRGVHRGRYRTKERNENITQQSVDSAVYLSGYPTSNTTACAIPAG